MVIESPYQLNTMAVNLLSNGQFSEAITELKSALSSIKNALDSCEPEHDLQPTNLGLKNKDYVLRTTFVHREGYKNDHHVVPMFNKVFEIGENVDEGNLLATVLLYNMAVAYSMQQHECSVSTHTIKLYRFSLQILHDSGLMWDHKTNLLLMALYNNIAHLAFRDLLHQYAEESLRELSLMLMDDPMKNRRTGEDFEFFESNSLVWANEINLFTSPAA